MEARPLLAVTMGDPVGIGPEVVVKALSVRDVRAVADVAVVGDIDAIRRAVRLSSLSTEVVEIAQLSEAKTMPGPDRVGVLSVSSLGSFEWASPTVETGRAQLAYVHEAVKQIGLGNADAIVTAPMSKASIARAGATWSGHTEMLAELLSEDQPLEPVMMLAGERLRVVTLTTHVALCEVPALVTEHRVFHTVEVTHEAFRRYFNLDRPRIAVAGLNPHASEGGMFGEEEAKVIIPTLEKARSKGIAVSGPWPADTIFKRAVDGEFDVVIGMYHDQALIPVKLLDFDRAVNVTLGLPLVRTSVDHGTAYDLAGVGVASAGSMISALRLAASMVRSRLRQTLDAARRDE